MRISRVMLLGALGVMLGALPVATAAAQADPGARLRPYGSGTVPAAELFYTRLSMDGDGTTRLDADGFGGRLTWGLGALAGSTNALAARTELGLFGTYTPMRSFDQPLRFSTATFGADVGVRPLPRPLLGRIDPFVNVGAGVLRVDRRRAQWPAPSPLVERSSTSFTLAPSVGAHLRLTDALALQGHVRDFMTFRTDTRHNVAFGAGLRLGF